MRRPPTASGRGSFRRDDALRRSASEIGGPTTGTLLSPRPAPGGPFPTGEARVLSERSPIHGRLAALAALALTASLLGACGDDGGPPMLTWYVNPDNGGQG